MGGCYDSFEEQPLVAAHHAPSGRYADVERRAHNAIVLRTSVELRGLEPLTPTLPVWCATSCATAPSCPISLANSARPEEIVGQLGRPTGPDQPSSLVSQSTLLMFTGAPPERMDGVPTEAVPSAVCSR